VSRTIVRLFTLIFTVAVIFSLIRNPSLVHTGFNDTAGLVRAVRGDAVPGAHR
jgi:hypothetical protein